jgi:hypothetical protein
MNEPGHPDQNGERTPFKRELLEQGPHALIARLHVLLAETLRCLDDGRLDKARGKVAYADFQIRELTALLQVSGATTDVNAVDPVVQRGTNGLRATTPLSSPTVPAPGEAPPPETTDA